MSVEEFIAVVDSVREDGTVNLLAGADLDTGDPGFLDGVPVAGGVVVESGASVAVRSLNGQMYVAARLGPPLPTVEPEPPAVTEVTQSNSGPPSGAGWTETTVYAKAGGSELWFRNVIAEPDPEPATTGTVTLTTKNTANYRPDAGWEPSGPATQGRYSGSSFGNHTGLWFFGAGAWDALLGKQIDRGTKHPLGPVRASLGRVGYRHGTYSGVPVHLWAHGHPGKPAGAPNLAVGPSNPGRLALGVRDTFGLRVDFGEFLRDHPDGGIACYGAADDYLIYADSLTVEIDWKD